MAESASPAAASEPRQTVRYPSQQLSDRRRAKSRVNIGEAYAPWTQVIVWGDYGRMDHKSFMGVAQILLEELDLSSTVIGWYKLFPPSSLVDPTLASLTRRASQSSLDSSSGPPGVRS